MAADQITLDRIKTLHPDIREEVEKMYLYANNVLLGKGVRLRFSYTYRSPEEQTELYNQGRMFKGKIVTNAKAYQSYHNYGLAFDIVLLVDKNNDGIFESASWDINADFDKDLEADWMEITLYFKSLGWKWGGDFKSLKDYPHFEKSFGFSTSQLKQKLKGKYPEL